MFSWKIKKSKAVVSFSSYTPKNFRNAQNRNLDGELSHETLSPKGQLFIIASTTNTKDEKRIVPNGMLSKFKAPRIRTKTLAQEYFFKIPKPAMIPGAEITNRNIAKVKPPAVSYQLPASNFLADS